MTSGRQLLWIDGTAGVVAGVAVLALSGLLSQLEGLPRRTLLFTGAVNLLYGSCSLSLAVQSERPARLVERLALANLAWAPVCLGLATRYRGRVTPLGLAHLVGEAVFVGGLGAVEWWHRDRVATAPR